MVYKFLRKKGNSQTMYFLKLCLSFFQNIQFFVLNIHYEFMLASNCLTFLFKFINNITMMKTSIISEAQDKHTKLLIEHIFRNREDIRKDK